MLKLAVDGVDGSVDGVTAAIVSKSGKTGADVGKL